MGRLAINSLMKCVSLNVHRLHDGWRSGAMGGYLHEWEAMMVCLLKTMLGICET